MKRFLASVLLVCVLSTILTGCTFTKQGKEYSTWLAKESLTLEDLKYIEELYHSMNIIERKTEEESFAVLIQTIDFCSDVEDAVAHDTYEQVINTSHQVRTLMPAAIAYMAETVAQRGMRCVYFSPDDAYARPYDYKPLLDIAAALKVLDVNGAYRRHISLFKETHSLMERSKTAIQFVTAEIDGEKLNEGGRLSAANLDVVGVFTINYRKQCVEYATSEARVKLQEEILKAPMYDVRAMHEKVQQPYRDAIQDYVTGLIALRDSLDNGGDADAVTSALEMTSSALQIMVDIELEHVLYMEADTAVFNEAVRELHNKYIELFE